MILGRGVGRGCGRRVARGFGVGLKTSRRSGVTCSAMTRGVCRCGNQGSASMWTSTARTAASNNRSRCCNVTSYQPALAVRNGRRLRMRQHWCAHTSQVWGPRAITQENDCLTRLRCAAPVFHSCQDRSALPPNNKPCIGAIAPMQERATRGRGKALSLVR
jgi:hypothetical protein